MIWLVGSRGMLGRDVAHELGHRAMHFTETDLDCDITEAGAVQEFARGKRIDWIINCTGYTAVDKAEDEEQQADLVNAAGVENLGRIAAAVNARVIHVSTDYVFDGRASSPYREDAMIAPRSAYGRTKARGEQLLAQAVKTHFIVRTAWLYGTHGKNFVATMLRLMNERDEVSVVDDQRGSPTYTRDLASAIATIVELDSRTYGIYHFTNEGETTWHSFASAIYESGRTRGLVRHACRIKPIRTDQYPTRAVRPAYSVLSKDKIRETFGLVIPEWQDGLYRYLDELRAGNPT